MPPIDNSELMQRLLGAFEFTQEGLKVDVQAVRDLVRSNPDQIAHAVYACLDKAAEFPTLLEIAEVLAAAYMIDSGDDCLAEEVNAARARLGRPSTARVRVEPEEAVADRMSHAFDRPTSQDKPTILSLLVDAREVRSANIHPYVVRFSPVRVGPTAYPDLVKMQGRCLLTFTCYDDDPRNVVEIPEARRFIKHLHEAMPYFPYYLNLDLRSGMLVLYFGCLVADDSPSAVVVDQGLVGINPGDPVFMATLLASSAEVGKLTRLLGDDPRPVWRQMLALYPTDTASDFIETLEGVLT